MPNQEHRETWHKWAHTIKLSVYSSHPGQWEAAGKAAIPDQGHRETGPRKGHLLATVRTYHQAQRTIIRLLPVRGGR